MTRIADFTAVGQQQLSLEELLAAIAQEEAEPIESLPVVQDPGRNGHECEVLNACHAGHGIQGKAYICGWRGAGTVAWCPRRRSLEMRSPDQDP